MKKTFLLMILAHSYGEIVAQKPTATAAAKSLKHITLKAIYPFCFQQQILFFHFALRA